MCLLSAACEGTDTNDGLLSVPDSASSFEGEHYEDVIAQFEDSGFTNITARPQEDLITGWLTKEGETESVSINGETDFSSYDRFSPDANIVVTYHAFPEDEDSSGSGDDEDNATDDGTDDSQQSPAQDDETVITAENNEEFAALLEGNDTGSAVSDFADSYQGRTIEFDGYTASVTPHDGYTTRFDYLILAGDDGDTLGPNFHFSDVNYYDLHLSDDAPDTFGAGLNIHVKATVVRYDPDTAFFELDPVSISMR